MKITYRATRKSRMTNEPVYTKAQLESLWASGLEQTMPNRTWNAVREFMGVGYKDHSVEDLKALGWRVKRHIDLEESDIEAGLNVVVGVAPISGGKKTLLRRMLGMVFR
jgi:hypothetical protein